MFNQIKNELYFIKSRLLLEKSKVDGSIIPFDEEFYKQMDSTYISCLPISMHIKYLKPTSPPGKCHDRSLYMFLCFDNAILVRADNKDLEILYGKENANHGWIEIDDYVYDPSLLSRFDKETFYKIYMPTNIYKCTKEEYCSNKENKDFYDKVRSTKLEDYQPNGKRRIELISIIPLLKGIVKCSENENFQKDFDTWLETIQYDEQQICEEMDQKLKQYTKK